MLSLPTISTAEMTVLKALWESHPTTVREMQDGLSKNGSNWAYTTIQTLLNRLVAKRVVRRIASGAAHLYEPSITPKELLALRVKDLANQFCDGAASQVLAALVDTNTFTKSDFAEFRRLIDELDSDGKRK